MTREEAHWAGLGPEDFMDDDPPPFASDESDEREGIFCDTALCPECDAHILEGESHDSECPYA